MAGICENRDTKESAIEEITLKLEKNFPINTKAAGGLISSIGWQLYSDKDRLIKIELEKDLCRVAIIALHYSKEYQNHILKIIDNNCRYLKSVKNNKYSTKMGYFNKDFKQFILKEKRIPSNNELINLIKN